MDLKKDIEQTLINLETKSKLVTPIYRVTEEMLETLVKQEEKKKVLELVNSNKWWGKLK